MGSWSSLHRMSVESLGRQIASCNLIVLSPLLIHHLIFSLFLVTSSRPFGGSLLNSDLSILWRRSCRSEVQTVGRQQAIAPAYLRYPRIDIRYLPAALDERGTGTYKVGSLISTCLC